MLDINSFQFLKVLNVNNHNLFIITVLLTVAHIFTANWKFFRTYRGALPCPGVPSLLDKRGDTCPPLATGLTTAVFKVRFSYFWAILITPYKTLCIHFINAQLYFGRARSQFLSYEYHRSKGH